MVGAGQTSRPFRQDVAVAESSQADGGGRSEPSRSQRNGAANNLAARKVWSVSERSDVQDPVGQRRRLAEQVEERHQAERAPDDADRCPRHEAEHQQRDPGEHEHRGDFGQAARAGAGAGAGAGEISPFIGRH
jgi:hypothetical protein